MDQERPNTDFLYDFLYLDRPRAQSWLAQLFADGVPTSSKMVQSSTDTNGINASGGVPTVVGVGKNTVNSVVESMERQFNTEWSLPLNLVDMLDEADYIARDLELAPQGSLVHMHGQASIVDIRFLQEGWEPITTHIHGQQKLTHANKQLLAAAKAELDSIGGMIRFVPPMPQLYLHTAEGLTAWAVLKSEHMIVDTSALTLTYGADIKGDWHMIAVLDALPDDDDASIRSPVGNPFTDGILDMLRALRAMTGRPAHAYGLSPITIFRAIKPRK